MEKIHGIAFGESHPNYFEMTLSEDVIEHYRKIKDYLRIEWKNEEKRRSLLEIRGCLAKFSAVIMQIDRLYNHQKILLKNLGNFVDNDAKMMAIDIEEACYDFEALLLHTRSTLDRLTLFMTKTNDPTSSTNSFKKFRSVLNNNFTDPLKKELLSVLDECKWLEDFIVTRDNLSRSVRDTIAHYSSFNERTEYSFSIARVGKDEFIVTDMESHGVRLFQSTWNLSYYFPFIVLNVLASYTIKEKLELIDCIPKWENLTVGISGYLEELDDLPLKPNNVMVCKYFNPDGFTHRFANYTEELENKKLLIAKTPPRRKPDKLKEGFKEITTLPSGFILMLKRVS
jgi:hypothetical protein